jgi:hypothetical protein
MEKDEEDMKKERKFSEEFHKGSDTKTRKQRIMEKKLILVVLKF